MDTVAYNDTHDLALNDVLPLYAAHGWSAAHKPEVLLAAFKNSHTVISAWVDGTLVGIGNAISDGHLVVYYPHLLVLPTYERKGIGSAIMKRLMRRYSGFHQQMLVADCDAVAFYERQGFVRAGRTVSMWIYAGTEH